MRSNVEIDHGLRAVVVTVEGAIDAAGVAALVGEARDRSAEHGYGIVYDLAAASLGNISISDIFWLPRTLPALKSPTAKRTRVALVHAPETAEFARFWETAFMNAGLEARAFSDRAAAASWVGQAPAGD